MRHRSRRARQRKSSHRGFLEVARISRYLGGRERGFYRNHGIDAEIIAMRPPLTIGAIQAGEIDYAFGASTISRGSISGAPVGWLACP